MKSLIALLLMPTAALAATPYDFIVNANTYQLLESSVTSAMMGGVFTVGAMWEVTAPKDNWRWIVQVQNCGANYGLVTIHGEETVNRHTWSREGIRTYDLLATATCASYFYSSKDKK